MTEYSEDLAARLTHFQLLDLNYVAREGRLGIIPDVEPWKPLRELIMLEVLKVAPGNQRSPGRYVIPGHRFQSVLAALRRSGRVREREVE